MARNYLRRFREHPTTRLGRIRQAASGERTFPGGLIEGFAHGICGQGAAPSGQERLQTGYHFVDPVTSNIRGFLRDRVHISVSVENTPADFTRFLDWIAADGDRAATWLNGLSVTALPDFRRVLR